MSIQTTAFYRKNTPLLVDFTANEISSDGAVLLLEKLERKYKVLDYFSSFFSDTREPGKVRHSVLKLLKQRVFMLIQGYEDCNDVAHLKNDPVLKDVLEGALASQPTLSRFEGRVDKQMLFSLSYAWIDRYIDSLAGRSDLIIDIDATDDPTHGAQQLSLFNGFYGQYMYNELLFHDGHTGQLILPVLRPGNSHSNRWYVSILKRIVERIRRRYPDMIITVRADSGFSCAPFYHLADTHQLRYAVGIPSNEVLKRQVASRVAHVTQTYVQEGIKHQEFLTYEYQAGTWDRPGWCHSKIESTGKGLNVRHIMSNIPEKTGEEIYRTFYVQRGEASENRIKELKNMCFSDRLSTHGFWSNFLRLFFSALAYEFFVLLKQAIGKTKVREAKRWQIQTIRSRLLKVGTTVHTTKRRIYYHFSKAFVYQELFRQLIAS